MQRNYISGEGRNSSLRRSQTPGRPDAFEALATSECAATSGDQVDDQDDQRDHQQNVDQTAGNVKAEAENPKNKKNDENSPKHILSFASLAAALTQIKTGTIPPADSQ